MLPYIPAKERVFFRGAGLGECFVENSREPKTMLNLCVKRYKVSAVYCRLHQTFNPVIMFYKWAKI